MRVDCDSSEDDFDEIDWAPIEAAIVDRRPSAVPFDWRIRFDIVDELREFKRRTAIRNEGVTKAKVFKECDAISGPAFELEKALRDQYDDKSGYYLFNDEGEQTEKFVPIAKILKILESIGMTEEGYARLIDKNLEVDPVPPRKRLGIAMFSLGEREFNLSSKRTTPTDRGIAKPSGELFEFVSQVLRLVGENVTPTTLEQWSRDAQDWKREAAKQARESEVQRADLLAWLHGGDHPLPDRHAGVGTYEMAGGDFLPFLDRPQRDWMFLEQDESIERDWLRLDDEPEADPSF